MAVNVRKLDIANQGPGCMVLMALNTYWSSKEGAPFQNLEALEVGGVRDQYLVVPILPCLSSLKVASNDGVNDRITLYIGRSEPIARYFITPAPLPTIPTLSKLELFGICNIDAVDVAVMVTSPWLANLRELSVYSCYKPRPGFFEPNIMSNLLRALEHNIPLLESFEWTRHDSRGPDFGRFDSFRGLKSLQCLLVDFDLLVPPTDKKLEALDDPHSLFPASLRELTLDNFTVAKVHQLVARFHRAIGEVESLGEAVSKALRYFAAKFEPLETLVLGINMEEDYDEMSKKASVLELHPEDVVFFRFAADELVKTGLKMIVERMPGFYEGEYKTLVEPGYTAPLPHSVTSDDDG